jgi:ribosomal protein S18 acetylase RimI-like enzyme
MIRYFVDKEKKYLEELLVHLRAHNNSNFMDKVKASKYIYVYDKNQLVGAITASLGWSWVGYETIYYKNVDVLRALISESVSLFKGKTIGYKMYSSTKMRVDDLKQSGFHVVGTVPGTVRTGNVFYLDLEDLEFHHSHPYKVDVYDTELEQHKDFLMYQIREYKQLNNLNQLQEEILYVAMDDDIFCGAVQFQVYQDSMYIDLLAVNNDYRGKNIGTNLMKFAEAYAEEHKLESIDLGTAEFQARPFYEKLGYKIVYTRKDYPKGFECYTLYKKL